jgi:hypothetical protein
MTEETKVIDGSLDNEVLTFKFTIAQINGLMQQVLGQAPFIVAAPYIEMLQRQAGPQVDQLIAEKEKQDESKTVT